MSDKNSIKKEIEELKKRREGYQKIVANGQNKVRVDFAKRCISTINQKLLGLELLALEEDGKDITQS